MQERMILTVGQLNLMIKDIFGQLPGFGDITVRGEISNFRHHTSGHLYMSLKDETGTLKAVMFRSAACTLSFKPENGMEVLARGRISVYERDGIYQLYINSMEQGGKGDLNAAFLRLKEKLEREGLFEPSHKKQIPKYPEKIGVVTAPTGAAVRDIINILSRRFPYADIVLYPVLVQGSGAAESISAAIEYFNKKMCADVLIVGRGGGSIEDLWAFNEEILARSIFASQIPIISAVGHETDFTIADFVADLRAPTPSAAAELAVPSRDELSDRVSEIRWRMEMSIRSKIEKNRMALLYYSDKEVLKRPRSVLDEHRIYIDSLHRRLEGSAVSISERKRLQLGKSAAMLDGLSPLSTLSRGFSLTKDEDGRLIKSVVQLKKKSKISVILSDGEAEATVESIKERS